MNSDDVLKDDERRQLETLLGVDVAPLIDRLPKVMQRELLVDDSGFLQRFQVTTDLVRRMTEDMSDLASPDVMRLILRETAFFKTRMQPVAGQIGCVASQRRPGYSYFPYVPVNFDAAQGDDAALIVAVHGSARNAIGQRNNFAHFAETERCFVLAPLFPIDLSIDVPDEEYKYVIGSRVRYDEVLFDLIDEFAEAARVRFTRIALFGFSGGGQFANRMMYIHPERFAAVSIGAPGYVTRLDPEHDWWVGTRDVKALAGRP